MQAAAGAVRRIALEADRRAKSDGGIGAQLRLVVAVCKPPQVQRDKSAGRGADSISWSSVSAVPTAEASARVVLLAHARTVAFGCEPRPVKEEIRRPEEEKTSRTSCGGSEERKGRRSSTH